MTTATRYVADGSTSSTLYFGPWYRRSPFFEKTLAAGCSAYDIYNHMYLPGYYADPVEEYWALLNGVTVWDVSAHGRSFVVTDAAPIRTDGIGFRPDGAMVSIDHEGNVSLWPGEFESWRRSAERIKSRPQPGRAACGGP